MGIEIERKFLVQKEIWDQIDKPNGLHCVQAYLLNEPEKIIRIRLIGDKAFITIKGKTVDFSRSEFEYEIPFEEGQAILDQFGSSPLVKTRYLIPHKHHTWEVDIFHKENEGLIVAEIELESNTEEFSFPEWLGAEVSDDSRYFNACLQKNPFKNW
jgi:CYTH domain-containing protein